MQLSVIIPVYNEEATIRRVLEGVLAVELMDGISKQIVLVDDGSIDGTHHEINRFMDDHPKANLIRIRHEKNLGKGSALNTGIKAATGDFIIIQDADLEYDPREYNLMLKPMVEGFADVVYGSRFVGSQPHRVLFFFHSLGNRFLTFFSNLFTNINITDMESGFKLFRSEILKQIKLKEKRFGFEAEVTARISRIPGIRIYEIGISYYGRTYPEGKKVNWKDGFHAIWCIIKYNLVNRK
ncbi:MAG: glycosyltransferase family 2 protein [Bacteroidales bacterium]|nr:glycosyltransferase family 2 protein [Bacteroidales bacterium]